MQSDEAVSALAALGQSTRLATFRLLVQTGPGGLRASEIADTLAVPRNTMSAHLKILSAAGLIQSQRASREIIYRPDLTQLASLTSFLIEGCCGGDYALCEPGINDIRALAAPADR